MRCTPVWADSLGAKSACWLVETVDCSICIDPGVAIIHGSYPLPDVLKADRERRANGVSRAALAVGTILGTPRRGLSGRNGRRAVWNAPARRASRLVERG